MAMIGIRCESDKLIEVAEALAEMPEVDYVVITAGTYDLLIETVCEDNEALLRFLADRLRSIDGRPRDRDVRLPAAGQADLPVRDALTRLDGTGRCQTAPQRSGPLRTGRVPRIR